MVFLVNAWETADTDPSVIGTTQAGQIYPLFVCKASYIGQMRTLYAGIMFLHSAPQ